MEHPELKDIETLIRQKFSFLLKFGYIEEQVRFERLDTKGTSVPNLPNVVYNLINSQYQRRVEFTVYNNYYPVVYIYNTAAKSQLRVADFLEKKLGNRGAVHLMQGHTPFENLNSY